MTFHYCDCHSECVRILTLLYLWEQILLSYSVNVRFSDLFSQSLCSGYVGTVSRNWTTYPKESLSSCVVLCPRHDCCITLSLGGCSVFIYYVRDVCMVMSGSACIICHGLNSTYMYCFFFSLLNFISLIFLN